MSLASSRKMKVVCAGQAGAGKSCMMQRLVYQTFDEQYTGTVGVDFMSKTFFLPNEDKAMLQFWDTAGHARFQELIPTYLSNATVVLVVYDITDRQSFSHAVGMMDTVREHCARTVLPVFVGNKVDLDAERRVAAEEGKSVASELGALFYECSARENSGLRDMVLSVIGVQLQREAAEAFLDPASAAVHADADVAVPGPVARQPQTLLGTSSGESDFVEIQIEDAAALQALRGEEEPGCISQVCAGLKRLLGPVLRLGAAPAS